MLILLVIGIFFPCIYIKTRNRVQEEILQRCFLIFWIVALPGVAATAVVFVYNIFSHNLRLEVKSGMYSVGAFSITTVFVELPVMLLSSLVLQKAWAHIYLKTRTAFVSNTCQHRREVFCAGSV